MSGHGGLHKTNAATRSPVRFGVALPEKQGCVEARGYPGWGEGVAAGGTRHGPDAPWAPPVRGIAASRSPRGPERGAGPLPELLSGLRSQMLGWGEVEGGEKQLWRGGKEQKKRFGASFIHPILSTPTTTVSTAKPKPNAQP